ncbi:MAG: BON domain-containing protein [Vicinamibacteria bacterium]
MFGCFFRFIRLILVLAVLVAAGAAIYYYMARHPERAPWKEGAAAVRDKMATVTLSAQVRAAIGLRESLKNLSIDVSSEKDVVTLRGKVPNAETAKTVETTAASVPGVRQVVNFLEIDAASGVKAAGADDRSMGEKLDDEALELKVRAAFKLDKELSNASFEIKSIRKVIQISSATANPDQKKRAATVAQSVEGVVSAESR